MNGQARATRECLGEGCDKGLLFDGPGPMDRSFCPVCLGSGRVEAKPSVRDAVADAAQLREAYRQACYDEPKEHRYAGVSCLADILDTIQHYKVKRFAARAAFRAVPGLRGE